MRFMRGLMAGVSGLVILAIGTILGASNCIGSNGINTQCVQNNVSPTFSITMILGLLWMIVGPLYYWILEPIARLGKAKKNKQPKNQPIQQYQQSYQQQPQQQAQYSQSVNPASYSQPVNPAQYNQSVKQQQMPPNAK